MTKDKVEMVNAEQSAVATSDIPALSADVRRVIEFVATWRGLYAHTTNVEEGNYLRCLRCNGESVQHGRDLTPADVAHDKGCPIALAKAILPTLSCAGVASVADWQSLRSRLIKLAAKAVTGEGFLSPFVDDLPKSTPASIVRQAGAQRETLRLWGIEMRDIADLSARNKGVCDWSVDDATDGEIWETTCGQAFVFIDSGPKDNGMKFCCYCSKPLTETRITRTDEDLGLG